MNIFIAGASGLIGGNCWNYFKQQGWTVTGSHYSYPLPHTVFFNTLDLQDPRNHRLDDPYPDTIVHCGALTHVDYCEQHPEESYEKTVQSTMNLVDWARDRKLGFVYLSTDYVFDGMQGPYREEDTPNPLSVYGTHKREAERYVLENIPQALILRVTNVYGKEARGKNFVARILSQCLAAEKLRLRLPYDQYASPTNAWDIARAMYLLIRDRRTGIFHIGGTDYMNRVELALRVLQAFPHVEYDLEACSTEALGQPAPRPLLGGFVHKKFSDLYPEFLFHTVDDYVREV